MTCPPHKFGARPTATRDFGGYVETTYLKGRACIECGAVAGPDKGILRVEYRQRGGPTGAVPDWLVSELHGGEWKPRLPRSAAIRPEIERLLKGGVVDADMIAHPRGGDLVVSLVRAPQAESVDGLTRLRASVVSSLPQAEEWASRATTRDLETARKILDTPGYRSLSWPSRVWNAQFREHSKQGDAARIAAALGCSITDRASSTGVWLYGDGSIRAGGRPMRVERELVVPARWLDGDIDFRGLETLGIVENRDLASMAPGLTLALDGQFGPAHHHVMSEAHRQGLAAWVWTDVDGAGITITRNVLKAHPGARVVGMREWPAEWALEMNPDQRSQATDAARVEDSLTSIARHILKVGWFEQERVFARACLKGVGWERLLRDDDWL